jgi:hypothetical protein
MRRAVLSVLCGIVLLAGLRSEAQESTMAPPLPFDNGPAIRARGPRTSSITIAPFSLWGGTIGVEYETAVAPALSVFVGPRISLGWDLGASVGGDTVQDYGGGVHAGMRWFITDDPAPEGFWLGPEVSAGFDSQSRQSNGGLFGRTENMATSDFLSFDTLAMVGYSVITRSGFDMSFGLGFGLEGTSAPPNAAITFRPTSFSNSANNGMTFFAIPALRVNMGYAF